MVGTLEKPEPRRDRGESRRHMTEPDVAAFALRRHRAERENILARPASAEPSLPDLVPAQWRRP
ncbi:hypothetical protein ATN84_22585 [Paramesorhizobium deserti]|uniref:Uncharacterized protein n=1 Tax=Paramesorhizobium deserti TaxID=1494590 RepID=A0A135HN99_9HYPH|nr:hypothetical protein ATN84_22585 [Paramesorhizobium deserti]